jgi:SCP-2 sterol transfer family
VVPYFRDADELYSYLGGLLEELNEDPELGPRFRKANTVVQYRTTNPDAVITSKLMEGEPGQVDCGDTALEPEVTLSMEADLAHRFWLGLVTPTVALARGEMTARGPVAKILKLVPLARPGFARYIERLEDEGRDDLLAPLRDRGAPAG